MRAIRPAGPIKVSAALRARLATLEAASLRTGNPKARREAIATLYRMAERWAHELMAIDAVYRRCGGTAIPLPGDH